MNVWIAIGIAYLIGSIPFGLIIAKGICGIDPRTAGSGNIGATNVARLCGKFYGFLALLCDVLKGVVPVVMALYFSFTPTFIMLVAFSTLLGHVFSCFLRFKGGKAVATTVGVIAPLAFFEILCAGIVALFLIWYTGFVSIGSIVLVVLLPVLMLVFGNMTYLPLALAIMGLVLWRHRQNIKRLINKEEVSWIKR